MNNLHADEGDSDFEEDLPSIDGAIIDNSGEMTIKPLAKTETADQARAVVQAPKSAYSKNEANPDHEEESVDSAEIESMLSDLESFENRQREKNTGDLKPQKISAANADKTPEPQRARNTSSFTESEVQRMLQELASIEAREEEAEEKKSVQIQQPLRKITREIKPVVPAPQRESGKHKIPQNPNRTVQTTYQPRASLNAAESTDQKRDRRSLLIAAAVLCFCGLTIIAGLIYERKNTSSRIEQSLTASGGQQLAKTNYEMLNLVRKAPSKAGGSTIDQEITNTLNRKHGRNWQPVGWKLDEESGEKAAPTVKFLWSERGVNKEAVWRIESGTRKITAANEDAALFTR